METINRVKELRKEKNVSQQFLANAIGISQSNLGSIERNESIPSASIALQLAKFFDCSIEYLLGESDTRKQPDISILATLKGDKLEIMKKLNDLTEQELKDLNSIIDILYKKN